MTRSASARTARPISRSSIWRRCAPSRDFYVYRPADPVETAECWALALAPAHAPSLLALTRQSVPLLRTARTRRAENRSARGAYVLAEADGATPGHAARHRLGGFAGDRRARELLAKDGIRAAVVSMPCWELFEHSRRNTADAVLGTAPRVAVEAAVRFGWDRWLGERGAFVGMERFWRLGPRRGAVTSISASRRKRLQRRRGCCSDPNAIRLGVVLTGADMSLLGGAR